MRKKRIIDLLTVTAVFGTCLALVLSVYRSIETNRRILAQKKLKYSTELKGLISRRATEEEVSHFLGHETKISNAEACEAIRRHARNDAEVNEGLAKSRWPLASFFTDGDFTFVVFFDSAGQIKDFVIGYQ